MAPHFEDLHPFAAFKLISTLQLLTKKHSRYLLQYSNHRNQLIAKRAEANQNSNLEEKTTRSDDVTLEEDETSLNLEVNVAYYSIYYCMTHSAFMTLRLKSNKMRKSSV